MTWSCEQYSVDYSSFCKERLFRNQLLYLLKEITFFWIVNEVAIQIFLYPGPEFFFYAALCICNGGVI